MSKKIQQEGIFDAADKFVAAFFDGLKKGAADQIIRQAEKAKLPSEALKTMRELEKTAQRFKQQAKKL